MARKRPAREVAPPTVEQLEVLKNQSIAQRLIRCGRLAHEAGMRRTRVVFPEIRQSHFALFAHIDHEGTRVTTLADRAGVSKQAVSQTVGDLLRQGIVEHVPDPADGRAKLVRFSDEGRRAIAEGLGVLATIDAELEQALGPRGARALLKALAEADDVLVALGAD